MTAKSTGKGKKAEPVDAPEAVEEPVEEPVEVPQDVPEAADEPEEVPAEVAEAPDEPDYEAPEPIHQVVRGGEDAGPLTNEGGVTPPT